MTSSSPDSHASSSSGGATRPSSASSAAGDVVSTARTAPPEGGAPDDLQPLARIGDDGDRLPPGHVDGDREVAVAGPRRPDRHGERLHEQRRIGHEAGGGQVPEVHGEPPRLQQTAQRPPGAVDPHGAAEPPGRPAGAQRGERRHRAGEAELGLAGRVLAPRRDLAGAPAQRDAVRADPVEVDVVDEVLARASARRRAAGRPGTRRRRGCPRRRAGRSRPPARPRPSAARGPGCRPAGPCGPPARPAAAGSAPGGRGSSPRGSSCCAADRTG